MSLRFKTTAPQSQSATNNRHTKYPALDGLRGFAALLVFFAHAEKAGLSFFSTTVFTGAGKVGVYIFFSLSAFLLTNNFRWKRYGESPLESIPAFYLSRACRIFIPYYLVLGLGVLNYSVFKLPGFLWLSPDKFIDHLFFIQAQGVFWSVAVEIYFYILLPFLLFFFGVSKNNLSFMTLLGSSFLVLCWLEISPQSLESLNVFFWLPIFIGGVAAQRLVRITPKSQILSSLVVPLTLLSLPTYLGYFVEKSQAWALLKMPLFWGFFCCLLVTASAQSNGRWDLLHHRSMRVFGSISFGIYLLHGPILSMIQNRVGPDVNSSLKLALALGITLLSSWIFFKLIEEPCHRLAVRSIKWANIPQRIAL